MALLSSQSAATELVGQLATVIVRGASLDEALDHIFESFGDLLPYDRIGFADIDSKKGLAIARWSRSIDRTLLRNGYSAELAHSSLSIVIERRLPRILNNLPEYLVHRPESRSTELIVREGIKSSMTCPLFIDEEPVGMLFFSSRDFDTYSDDHVRVLKEIAGQLATLLTISDQDSDGDARPRRPTNRHRKHEDWGKAIDFSAGQLRPGMVLSRSIRLASGSILLAAGTRLSQKLIDRLVKLSEEGITQVDSVMIR